MTLHASHLVVHRPQRTAGQMWGIDPNGLCDRHFLFPEKFTLAEWLTDWLKGNDTFPDAPMHDCSNC